MATIPRAALDYVTEQVNGLSADAQAKVLRVLEALDWRPHDAENVAACRQAVVDALASIMPTYVDAAAQASADFYDASRKMIVGEPLGARAISGYDPAATEGAVRSFVRFALDGRVETFNDQVLQRIDYEMKRSAGTSMVENGKRDPITPRYARVPTGSETCPFCVMLASRGFVYRTEGTAGAVDHYHANCDCRIVCSWDTYASGVSRRRSADAEVEGYDMDALYDQYVDDLRSGKLKLGDVAKTTSHTQNWKSEDFNSYKDFADFIDGAEDIEDLQYRCAVAELEWGKTGLSDRYYERLRQTVATKRRTFQGENTELIERNGVHVDPPVESGLHELSRDAVESSASEMNEAIKRVWRESKQRNDYAGTLEEYIASFSGNGTIVSQRWAKPEGKELQVASWLAQKGHEIEFIKPSGIRGDRTPDIRLDGELWEIKRIETKNPTKMKSRISDGLNQSRNVIVDLSINEDADTLEATAIEMLEDPRASQIMVIIDGSMRIYKK